MVTATLCYSGMLFALLEIFDKNIAQSFMRLLLRKDEALEDYIAFRNFKLELASKSNEKFLSKLIKIKLQSD